MSGGWVFLPVLGAPVTHGRVLRFGTGLAAALARVPATGSVLHRIKGARSPINVLASLLPFCGFLDFIGLPEVRRLDRRSSDETCETV